MNPSFGRFLPMFFGLNKAQIEKEKRLGVRDEFGRTIQKGKDLDDAQEIKDLLSSGSDKKNIFQKLKEKYGAYKAEQLLKQSEIEAKRREKKCSFATHLEDESQSFFKKFSSDLMAFLNELKDKFTTKDPYQKLIYICLALCYAILFIIGVMSMVLYIMLQVQIFKRKSTGPDYQAKKLPYYRAIEYQAIKSLQIIAKYPYQVLYILSLVGICVISLAYLFMKQIDIDIAVSGGTGSSGFSGRIYMLLFIFAYLFLSFYYVVQIKFKKNVQPVKDKVDGFNQYIRSLMPANYDFLKALSTPPQYRSLNHKVISALASMTPNVKDISRSICLVNLYNYYVSQYVEGDPDLYSVLSCFDPINRLMLTKVSCYSDYLMKNDTYIENNVVTILRYIDDLEGADDVKLFIQKNRLDILTKVDEMMNTMNEKANCLDSATAFAHFTRMALMVLLLFWVPAFVYIWLFYAKRNSVECSPDDSSVINPT